LIVNQFNSNLSQYLRGLGFRVLHLTTFRLIYFISIYPGLNHHGNQRFSVPVRFILIDTGTGKQTLPNSDLEELLIEIRY